MIRLGNSPVVLTRGDHSPAALFLGERQLGGYQRAHLSGMGQVCWESPYETVIPQVTVWGTGRQEKKTGRNKLDILSNSIPSGSASVTINQGVITAAPTGSSELPGSSNWSSGWYMASFPFQKGKTYTISLKCKPIAEKFHGIQYHDSIIGIGGNQFPFHIQAGEECFASATFTADAKHEQEGKFRVTLNDCTMEIRELMVEEGDTVHPYEPYWYSPNPLHPSMPQCLDHGTLRDGIRPLPLPTLRGMEHGSVRDSYQPQTGIITRRIMSLDLTEYPLSGPHSDGANQSFLFELEYKAPHDTEQVNCICSHYRAASRNFIWRVHNDFMLSVTDSYIRCVHNSMKTVDEMRQFLRNQAKKGTPVTVWYVLAHPITEKGSPVQFLQHPGYNQLSLTGSAVQGEITADVFM